MQATCVEFPAGLIDEGESPEEAAVRELKEETGYEGKVLDCSPTIVADPGLTDANMQVGGFSLMVWQKGAKIVGEGGFSVAVFGTSCGRGNYYRAYSSCRWSPSKSTSKKVTRSLSSTSTRASISNAS